MTIDIDGLLKKWKSRLGLSDWNIKISFRDAWDMGQYPAKTKIQPNTQNADIRLMSPDDRQACDPQDADIESDIVHELVHVRLWAIDPLDAEGALYTCREQAIDWIAKALIASDRRAA